MGQPAWPGRVADRRARAGPRARSRVSRRSPSGGELVLEESGRQQRQAPRSRGHGHDSAAPARWPPASRAGSAAVVRDGAGRVTAPNGPPATRRHGRDAGRHAQPEPMVGGAVVELERAAERRAVGVQGQEPARRPTLRRTRMRRRAPDLERGDQRPARRARGPTTGPRTRRDAVARRRRVGVGVAHVAGRTRGRAARDTAGRCGGRPA